MEFTIISLITIAIVLLVISFFKTDKNKEVENQIENFSITLMQEIYLLKKKIKVLEEEILIGQDNSYFTNQNNDLLNRDKVLSLYEEGYSVEEIADMTGASKEAIDELLANA